MHMVLPEIEEEEEEESEEMKRQSRLSLTSLLIGKLSNRAFLHAVLSCYVHLVE